jgi:peptidoglycan-N-acetylglucosamine deacetylase
MNNQESDTPKSFWPDGKVAAFSLSFDDGQPSQIKVGVPIFESHGIKASFYPNPWSAERHAEDWKEVAANGHEIGNHTSSHPCSKNFSWSKEHALEDFSLKQMEKDITDASGVIQSRIGCVPKTFAYPCGQTFVGRGQDVQSYVPLISRLFLAGRGFNSEFVNDPSVCDLAQLGGIACDERDFSDLKNVLDRARDEKGWLIFAGHHIAAKGVQVSRTKMLDQLCAYVSDPAHGFWHGTIVEIAEFVKSKQKG